MGTFNKLDVAYLKPGDILVSTTSATESSIIRMGTHSVVSHAMLYIGEGKVIEAIGEGVKIRLIEENINSRGYKNVMAYRYPSLSSNKAELMVGYATRLKGKGYDFKALVGVAESSDALLMRANPYMAAVLNPIGYGGQMLVHHFAQKGSFNDVNKYFCSELVFESYQKSGVILMNQPPHMSYPQQIIDLGAKGSLNYLGNLN